MSARSRRKKLLLLAFFFTGLISAYFLLHHWRNLINNAKHQQLKPLQPIATPRDAYDVIVAGADPEGVTAAVSAARNGLKVLLVDGHDILGGVTTLGWLNSLDLNYSPKQQLLTGKYTFLNKGLFQKWYDQLEGTSFDVNTAANAFNQMVTDEKNIDVLLKVQKMEPIVEGQRVAGLRIAKADGSVQAIRAKALIDATPDADIAAVAGVPYTYGSEDINDPNSLMAVTLVFKLSGVTQDVWQSFAGHKDTQIDKMSAWGFHEASKYVSSNPKRIKLRALNIGRQNDQTILINAMHIFDVNPLNPNSVQEGLDIGRKESPRIVDYLRKTFKEFKDLQFAGTAPELYVRESRHIIGEYRLKITDLMENRDQWDAIAYGSYEVDIQSTTPHDPGYILMKPKQYGIPFRCLVPLKIDGLLVVGRSASFDSLPHGSTRVIPVGMATGEAAGAAAKLAIKKGITFHELSRSKADIAELRNLLSQQGVDLKMNDFPKPAYAKYKDFPGLLAAVSMKLTIGNKNNKGFELDKPSNAKRFAHIIVKVRKVHPHFFPGEAITVLENAGKQPLTLNQAAYTIALAAGIRTNAENALEELKKRKWLRDETIKTIADPSKLTNGDSYMLIHDVIELYAGIKYG
jgi:hypothetical protein